ncbi:pyridoxamine 5'-phosphate oxidase family protein [Polaribacter pectinis]|uniref:Pyridoxamine 5'-phosphate oxidase family protein n=1 Tax=Polaribacter pectinis TaxID=2738844 RepID=A0A7G9LAQ3_9FLAO|nr:pyridoxamine 5'-phosphate oxidase family protein [Polaribacter pectinis]QNM85702.1 pyridoxamine 5'-phosphate oxidase family protein [Polaribacter pectinis]
MEINIKENWQKIRTHFSKSFGTNMHVSIASVNEKNQPTVTPIGSLFLNDNQTGFYFEKFVTKLKSNEKTNKNICVLAVNSSKWFWLKSLFKMKFDEYAGVKLYGELGIKREATEKEARAFQRRVRQTKRLKGSKYLWQDMCEIREIKFTKAEKINLGKMTKEN